MFSTVSDYGLFGSILSGVGSISSTYKCTFVRHYFFGNIKCSFLFHCSHHYMRCSPVPFDCD